MKRSILTLAATAALLAGTATAAQAATTCYSIDVPATPAVYVTVTTPAVTVTEYEFAHRPDETNGNGQGPENKWSENANWNAQGNAHSVGWEATGNTRVRVLETERITVTLVTPEVPASVREECLELPDGISPVKVWDTEVPLGNPDVAAPAAPIVTPETVQPIVPAAVIEAPIQAVPAAAVAAPEELAYTGAQDWVFPAGLGLLGAGVLAVAGAVVSRRIR